MKSSVKVILGVIIFLAAKFLGRIVGPTLESILLLVLIPVGFWILWDSLKDK